MSNLFLSRAKVLLYVLTAAVLTFAAKGSDEVTSTNKWYYSLFRPVPPSLMRAFQTDRPSKTDGPYTVDAGHFQLEADFANFTHYDEAGVRNEIFQVASTFNLRIGLLNNMDLQLFLPNYVRQEIVDQNLHTRTIHEGLSDTTVRLKINLFGNDRGTAALAVLPYVKVPTDTDGVGNHNWEGGLNVPLAVTLPYGFTLNAETGFGLLRDSDSGGHHAAFNNSIILYHAICGSLAGYGEFFSLVSSRSRDPWIGTADFGLLYQLTQNIGLDVGTAIGVTRSAPDYNVFGGIAIRF